MVAVETSPKASAAVVPATALDVDAVGDQDMGDGTKGPQKREAAMGTPDKRVAKEAHLTSPGRVKFQPRFTMVECGGKGCCGYNALAVGAAIMRGKSLSDLEGKHETLRVHVAQHVENIRLAISLTGMLTTKATPTWRMGKYPSTGTHGLMP